MDGGGIALIIFGRKCARSPPIPCIVVSRDRSPRKIHALFVFNFGFVPRDQNLLADHGIGHEERPADSARDFSGWPVENPNISSLPPL